MQRTRALVLVWLAACGGGDLYGTMPLGWRGSIPSCDGGELVGGTALRRRSTGYFEAVAAGRATLRCKGTDRTTDVAVEPIARLVIDGPTTIAAGDHPGYELHAFDADGEELRFGVLEDQPSEHVVTWTTTSGTIEPPPRSDMWPSAERRVDRVRLTPDDTAGAGTTITIGAMFATTAAKLAVVVR